LLAVGCQGQAGKTPSRALTVARHPIVENAQPSSARPDFGYCVQAGLAVLERGYRFASGRPPLRASDPITRAHWFARRAVFQKCCRVLRLKILRFTDAENQKYGARVPPRCRGRIAIVTTREAGMRWTCWSRRTSEADPYGEGVWSWRQCGFFRGKRIFGGPRHHKGHRFTD
jgi:hypothetical protein